MLRHVLGGLIATCLAACGISQPPPEGRTRDGIVGGEVDDGDLAVVYVKLFEGGCTGTLISPRMVLTAEHCEMSPLKLGSVLFGTAVNAPTRIVEVIDTIAHPSLDIRLAKLKFPIGDIVPYKISRTPMGSADIGRPLRHIGFGLDGYPMGVADTKRQVSLTVSSIWSDEIIFGSDDGLKGVCFGDSGGPGLMRVAGESDEVIVGVASHLISQPICTGLAADMRVDVAAPWIDEVTADWEAQTCEPGNGCKDHCSPVDSDCFCVHDNLCDLRCPKLTLDPDCDPECAGDGKCSGSKCPFRDPDCVAPGAACFNDAQCQSRTCATQGGKRFCSQGCQRTDECPSTMYCSQTNHVCLLRPLLGAGCDATLPCGEGLCASQADGGQSCHAICETSAGCLPTEQCLATSSSPGVCRPRVVVVEPPVIPKQGCAAAPGTLFTLAALAFVGRPRRKR